MTLAVSLRRAMLVLLCTAVSVLMVLYWNQGAMKPQSFISSFEKTVRGGNDDIYTLSSPIEKMWTYKCEGDRCVRHHYPPVAAGAGAANAGDGEQAGRRVPFATCSMACGEPNIWPYPTGKTMLSRRSFRFTVADVELRVDTPFRPVQANLEAAFELFRRDLRRIQRLPEMEDDMGGGGGGISEHDELSQTATLRGGGAGGDDGVKSLVMDVIQQATHKQRRRRRRHGSNDEAGGGGGAGETVLPASSHRHFANVDDARPPHADLDSVKVSISVQKSGEVHLSFGTDESYHLTISNEKRHLRVHIAGNTFFGARHGLATLSQLIWFDDEDNLLRILATAQVTDSPKFRYRGLMLDTSRHFFSVEAIKRTIAGMAHSKLNRFHWHMTDTQSFPFISKYYPELAAYGAYSDRETYTTDDVREVAAYAQLHGVQVIPEIDAPAHAGNGWDWGLKRGLGELAVCINQQPWSFYCGEPPCGQLNPKNNNTYLILQRLYEELLNLTGPTDYFHLGGDEVNLECWAQHFNDSDIRGLWCDFTLNALARLKLANGNKEPQIVSVWSSGLTNTRCLPWSQFAVQVWGGSTWQENFDLIDNGYNVIFSHVDAWYLDCGFGNWRSTGDGACSPYRTWQHVYKHRPWERMRLDKVRRKQVLGGEVCLWTEQVDEGQLDNRLWPRSAALAERLWSDPEDEHDMEILPQNVFKRMSLFRNRLVELGLKAEPVFPKYCAQNPGECI